MSPSPVPILKDLVLIGGGHSHVAVLKDFGMRPLPGVRLTLISKGASTPYSGMLPGHLAGHYTFEQAHIDLRPLCQFAGAQFYQSSVSGLDLSNRRVLLEDRPAARFDVLSINVGSTPRSQEIPGALEHALPVKPIEPFLAGWSKIQSHVAQSRNEVIRVAVVGGGAGGVELTLAVRHRLLAEMPAKFPKPIRLEFHLVTDSSALLPTHNPRVQFKFARVFRERDVQVHTRHRVVKVKPDRLICDPGREVPFDVCFWVTSASAPAWLGEAGLQTDSGGFVAVNDCLQSVSHPFVFAAGDVAAVLNHPRPKSGVFAVRQGAPLARNLKRALTSQLLVPYKPQEEFLSLISTGDKYAVASRGSWSVEGKWVWRWKDWIDRRWMRKYQELPEMAPAAPLSIQSGLADEAVLRKLGSAPMRCGGCGSKVGSTVLDRVLKRLPIPKRDGILVGLESPDDAAVTRVPPGKVSVQTVDFFRSFLNDNYRFGQVAAHHSLNDVFAMGAEPHSAMAIAVVPHGLEDAVEETLFQLMSGAAQVLEVSQTALVGGHSTEGMELSFGLVVHGLADPGALLRKGGMKPGDRLILTKPLGTGALFAAEMRRKAKGLWIERALESMLQSNGGAARCFLRHGATACTDVSGFGLAGHLVEMLQASRCAARVNLSKIPVMDGAMEVVRNGIFSSLQPENLRIRRVMEPVESAGRSELYSLLFDPQTSGGLLASVPEERSELCLRELQACGYTQAALIGIIEEASPDALLVRFH